jgi:hypothetical protein
MFPACSLHVPSVFPACSLRVPCIFPAHVLHIPCRFCACSMTSLSPRHLHRDDDIMFPFLNPLCPSRPVLIHQKTRVDCMFPKLD